MQSHLLVILLFLSLYQIIDAIGSALAQTPGCQLLDVDPGPSTNRTVYTFVGSPDAVVEGALNMARVARSLIDMRAHTGVKIWRILSFFLFFFYLISSNKSETWI